MPRLYRVLRLALQFHGDLFSPKYIPLAFVRYLLWSRLPNVGLVINSIIGEGGREGDLVQGTPPYDCKHADATPPFMGRDHGEFAASA